MNTRPILHIVGFDFDGCLLPETLSLSIEEHNKALLMAIDKQNRLAYAASFVFLSSNRQSKKIDEINIGQAHNRSCFRVFKTMVDNFKVKTTFFSMLLSDAYGEYPNGYSYSRAISKEEDSTAYHPGYIFDEFKSSLLYTQAHTAAKLARGCNFLSLDMQPSDGTLYKLPFDSNAAYIHIKQNNALLYVNKAEKQITILTVQDPVKLSELCNTVKDKIANEEHDFETQDRENNLLQGIALSDHQLDTMQTISGHRHVIKDYPMIFDFYDDRNDIFEALEVTFKSKAGAVLLPKNMTIRLHLYNGNHPTELNLPTTIIQGRGGIDLDPKSTLRAMAKQVLKKAEVEEDDYETSASTCPQFASAIQHALLNDVFSERTLVLPTAVHKSEDADYAPINLYKYSLDPEDVKKILSLMEKLANEKDRWMGFFNERKSAKYNFLKMILNSSITQDAKTACGRISSAKDDVYRGSLGSRTADLLQHLQTKYLPPTAPAPTAT